MTKDQAITLLGGTITKAAQAIGITHSAVSQWPDQLPSAIRDRVQAALYRKQEESISAHVGRTPVVESH